MARHCSRKHSIRPTKGPKHQIKLRRSRNIRSRHRDLGSRHRRQHVPQRHPRPRRCLRPTTLGPIQKTEKAQEIQKTQRLLPRRRHPLPSRKPPPPHPARLRFRGQNHQALGSQHRTVRQVLHLPHRQGLLHRLAPTRDHRVAER